MSANTIKSDVEGSELDIRSTENTRASRTSDKLEADMKEKLKNYDARNIDVSQRASSSEHTTTNSVAIPCAHITNIPYRESIQT